MLPILIVEDAPKGLAALRKMLDKRKLTYEQVEDRESAERKLASAKYSVILLDIRLESAREADPYTSGITLLERLRTGELNKLNTKTPVVVFTAYPELGFEDRMGDAGIEAFLAKPGSESKVLKELLRHAQPGEEEVGD